jgi:hypothetical protein
MIINILILVYKIQEKSESVFRPSHPYCVQSLQNCTPITPAFARSHRHHETPVSRGPTTTADPDLSTGSLLVTSQSLMVWVREMREWGACEN